MQVLSVVWMTLKVFQKRRPPSLEGLVWAAATVLEMVNVRDLLPGRPLIGIMLDFFVFSRLLWHRSSLPRSWPSCGKHARISRSNSALLRDVHVAVTRGQSVDARLSTSVGVWLF